MTKVSRSPREEAKRLGQQLFRMLEGHDGVVQEIALSGAVAGWLALQRCVDDPDEVTQTLREALLQRHVNSVRRMLLGISDIIDRQEITL